MCISTMCPAFESSAAESSFRDFAGKAGANNPVTLEPSATAPAVPINSRLEGLLEILILRRTSCGAALMTQPRIPTLLPDQLQRDLQLTIRASRAVNGVELPKCSRSARRGSIVLKWIGH